MLSVNEFIKQSLALHLFFARIMKEHAFFLEIGFTPKDYSFTNQADFFRKSFDSLLSDVIVLANGTVGPHVLKSGEVITPYTLKAEMATSNFTGIPIPIELTHREAALRGSVEAANPALEQQIVSLNNTAISLISSLIQFKTSVLTNVLACNMFTVNYPLLIEHIRREAILYLEILQKLQSRKDMITEKEIFEQEAFWNRIMAEHAEFIRGLLDPTEDELMMKANGFVTEFDRLTEEARKAMDKAMPSDRVTRESLAATRQIMEFKTAGTQGILDCKVKSIIIPLISDHVLREANHYLRLLETFKGITRI